MPTDPSHWQPQTILRFIQAFNTSAATVRVETDQGEGYLKPLGNTTGPHLLACELVGTELARRFGLPTFDFAIIEVTEDDEIPLHHGGYAQTGPAFITRAERGVTWGGSPEELSKLENLQDIARLVVFDTWMLNCDRHHPDRQTRAPHYDNVFLSTKGAKRRGLMLKAIDHTHCFTCGRDITRQIASIERAQEEQPYGLFPGFLPYLQREDVAQAINDLRYITATEITSVVQKIPAQWEVDQSGREALIDLISRRAAFLTDQAERIIESIIRTGATL